MLFSSHVIRTRPESADLAVRPPALGAEAREDLMARCPNGPNTKKSIDKLRKHE